jgi:hypothetical protein
MKKLTLATLSLAIVTLPGCKNLPKDIPASSNREASALGGQQDPFGRLDELRSRYPYYTWAKANEDQKLAEEFQPVRQTDAWKAFVRALRACDDAVNTLLEQDITDWVAAGSRIAPVNRARNAWRRASTFGIRPPKLNEGFITFEEEGLGFRLYVIDDTAAVLMTRSQRGQVLGIFDLRLDPSGRQHVVTHMLERAFRYPDLYLSYPFNVVMATDTIEVPDVTVTLDRVKGEAHVMNEAKGEVEVRK